MALSDYSRSDLIFIALMCLVNFFNWASYSNLGPFFPREAEDHQLVQLEYGIIIALYDITVAVLCPIWGMTLKLQHMLLLVKLSPILVGLSCTCFGLTMYIENKILYIIATSAFRISEGVGKSLFYVCSTRLLTASFKSVDVLLSTMEGFCCVGQIVGPILGGLLFKWHGFVAPFCVTGIAMLVVMIPGAFIMKVTPYEELLTGPNESQIGYLKKPTIWICLYSVFMVGAGWGVFAVGLEPFLRPLGLEPEEVGIAFTVPALMYCVSTPLFGYIVKYTGHYNGLIMATVLAVLSQIMLGPTGISLTIPLIFIALCLFGAGTGGQGIVGLLLPMKVANNSPVVSGMWQTAFAGGTISGEAGGGILISFMGFKYTILMFMMANIVLMVLLVPAAIISFRSTKQAPSSTEEEITREPLLSQENNHEDYDTINKSTLL